MSALKEIVRISSAAIRADFPNFAILTDTFGEEVAQQLQHLLQLKNGFYAFEAALHVLSDFGTSNEEGLLDWNREDLWRRDYKGMADDPVFFAEDVFGSQFCIRDGKVASFDPETGSYETIAANIEEWAQKVLDEYDLFTGHTLAHEWQTKHGPIPTGARLVPVTPFVLGGEYSVTNLHVLDAVKGMKYRASIAVQIRDLPNGTPITLRVIE